MIPCKSVLTNADRSKGMHVDLILTVWWPATYGQWREVKTALDGGRTLAKGSDDNEEGGAEEAEAEEDDEDRRREDEEASS